MCWTVVDIATGGEADGEGELVPPPLSPTLQPSYFSPASLARASGKGYPYPSTGPPTPPAPSALLPRPRRGAGSVRGDIRGAAVPGSSPGSPRALDRGDYRHGGWGRRGGGTRSPSPVSYAPDTLLLPATPTPPAPSPTGSHTLLPAPPPHPRLRRSSPAPPRAGSVPGRISGEQPYPGWSRWAAVFWVSPRSRRALDHGGYVRPPIGEAARREEVCPLPCLPRSQNPTPFPAGQGRA